MEKLLVSACLLGCACRYDGASKPNELVMALSERYELIPICPECAGGLTTPRPPAEQVGARVVTCEGRDVTAEYRAGAEAAVRLARETGARLAVLKARSPACGHGAVYDGSFTRTLRPGEGIAAAALLAAGVSVYTEEEPDHLPTAE